jgi:excisionase family DNA binding protein
MTIRTPLPPPAYKPREVAAMFGVHVRTLASWRKTGKIRYYMTPGGEVRYPRESTDALLASWL